MCPPVLHDGCIHLLWIPFKHIHPRRLVQQVRLESSSPWCDISLTFRAFRSISGTSSTKAKQVVASLSCSPDGRCTDININNLTLTYVSLLFVVWYWLTSSVLYDRPPSGAAKYTCQNVNLTGNAAALFPDCTVTWKDTILVLCTMVSIQQMFLLVHREGLQYDWASIAVW